MAKANGNSETKAMLNVFVAGVLWGLVGPLVKLMEINGSTAGTTSFVRMVFAALIMGAFTVWKVGAKSFKLDLKTLAWCAALGIVCNGIYNIVYTLAIANAGIAVSAVLLNTAPIFTTIASVLLFREGVSLLKILALAVNIVGASLAATGGQFDLAVISVLGILCGMASALTYGMAAVFSRMAGTGTNSYVMATYSFVFAALSVAIISQPWQTPEAFNLPVLGYGFILALLPTSIAYLVYYKGVLAMRETSKVPVIASVEMVATSLVSVTFFGETLNAVAIAGIVLVIASIAMMSVKPRAKRPTKTA